jgi:hypothetical protein
MAIHLEELLNVLFHPTDTFKRLKKDANLADGITLWLIATVIASVVSIVFSKLLYSRILASMPMTPTFKSIEWVYSDTFLIASQVIGVVVGLAMFVAIMWLTAKFAKMISNGTGDFPKTAGIFSYLGAAVELFITMPATAIMMLVMMSLPITQWGAAMPVVYAGSGILLLFAFVTVILAILFLVWVAITSGKAVGIANNISAGAGFLSVFLAGLIVYLIYFGVYMTVMMVLMPKAFLA